MTAVSPTTEPRRSRRRSSTSTDAAARSWSVDRDLGVDVAVLLVLTLIDLFGLHRVIDGMAWLTIGLVGAFAGAIAAWAVAVRRLSPAVGLLVVMAAFVLAGGVASPDHAVAGFLPGPLLPGALVDALVHSWKQFVTTAPPIATTDGIGVIPYLLGFVPMAAGLVIARRTDEAILPVLPALAALVAGIVLGEEDPSSLMLQGTVFAGISLGWGAVRANRPRRSSDGIYWPRIATGAGMLVIVAIIGTVFGDALPFTETQRTVARREIVPPFDPSTYASPLAGFRDYTVNRADDVLFRAEGLPKGSRIRLAVMDRYDGVVWSVSGGDTSGSGRFVRIGSRIPDPPAGAAASPTFTVVGYEDVWIPTAGALVSARFGGPSKDDLSQAFRYNERTSSAASPLVLAKGDRFDLDVRLPARPTEVSLRKEGFDQVDLPELPSGAGIDEALGAIGDYTTDRLAPVKQPDGYELVKVLTAYLRDKGKFANGDSSAGSKTPIEQQSTSGHSLMRLSDMVTRDELVGDGEQYAALLGVMLRQLGIPARVVVGFDAGAGGDVTLKGKDLKAWVEVRFSGGAGWVPFDPVPDEDQKPTEPPKVQQKKSDVTVQPPPPDRYLEPPADVEPLTTKRSKAQAAAKQAGPGLAVPGYLLAALRWGGPPIGLMLAVAALIVGAKVLRRRRRRSRGSAGARTNGAWSEIVDYLRDAGHHPHPKSTRRELAEAEGVGELWPTGPAFAASVDAAMFGPDALGETETEQVWARLSKELEAIKAPMSRRRRARIALSTQSLRRHRAPKTLPPLASSVPLVPIELPDLLPVGASVGVGAGPNAVGPNAVSPNAVSPHAAGHHAVGPNDVRRPASRPPAAPGPMHPNGPARPPDQGTPHTAPSANGRPGAPSAGSARPSIPGGPNDPAGRPTPRGRPAPPHQAPSSQPTATPGPPGPSAAPRPSTPPRRPGPPGGPHPNGQR